MKTVANLFWHLPILFLLTFASCSDDDTKITPTPEPEPTPTEITDPKSADEWIYKYMKDWYLWPEEIGAIASYNFNADYQTFFKSLLTKTKYDGKWSGTSGSFYSYISREVSTDARAGSTPDGIAGFDFAFVYLWIPSVTQEGYVNTAPFIVVNYVIPGSNAEGKLKRGDLIGGINGVKFTWANLSPTDGSAPLYYKLFTESQIGVPMSSFTLDIYSLEYSGSISSGQYAGQKVFKSPVLAKTTPVIEPKAMFEDPILTHKVLEVEGKKVGYMVYNSFITGHPEWENFDYDNKMKSVFTEFHSAGVNDVVIDLRYNGGGAVSSCLLMSSILAPVDKLGTNFGKYQRNADITAKYFSTSSPWQKFVTVSSMSGSNYGSTQGINLNKSKVYVLATGSSASASEMVINALRGIDVQVVIVGTLTEGKNVGMDLIEKGKTGVTHDGIYADESDGKKYKYSMRPITFYIYNAKEQADYASGFTPDCIVNETDCKDWNWKELGDPAEPLLAAALQHIKTGNFPSTESAVMSRSSQEPELPLGFIKPVIPNKNDGLILHHTDFTAEPKK